MHDLRKRINCNVCPIATSPFGSPSYHKIQCSYLTYTYIDKLTGVGTVLGGTGVGNRIELYAHIAANGKAVDGAGEPWWVKSYYWPEEGRLGATNLLGQ